MMTAPRVLQHQPLVEAIFELRWRHRDVPEDGLFRVGQAGLAATATPRRLADPNHEILVGALNGRIRPRLSAFERLDTASLPPEFMTHQVQYRWRRKRGGYPLVQLGPGVLTVNLAQRYDWESFHAAIQAAVDDLHTAHPEPDALIVEVLVLRYINAIAFDFDQEDPFSFLRERLRFHAEPSPDLFEANTKVTRVPTILDFRVAFPSVDPPGLLSSHIARGTYRDAEGFVWENQIESRAPGLPVSAQPVVEWAEAAHNVVHDWFFRTIQGELMERFR